MSIRERRKKKDSAPMPATGAGLMRYFEEDLPGKDVSPTTVIVFTTLLILVVLFSNTRFWIF